MSSEVLIAEMKDLNSKMDKTSFYLLITINVLVVITFFIIMMFMMNENLEMRKDVVAQNELLIQLLEQ